MLHKIKYKFLNLETLIAFFLIITGFSLRLWKLKQLFHFTYDEEIIAFVGKRIFVNGHIPLIGGVTPFHVHVAPYFYWLSAVLLWISNLNPLGWGVGAAFLAAITMWFLFLVARRVFGIRVAFTALVIYALSFWQNMFDRHYWGLVFDGVLSILAFYSLYQIIYGKPRFLILLSAVLAYGVHTDLSTLTLVLFALLSLLIWKPKIPNKTILVSLLLFCISFLPLFIFDLRHDFSNSRGILQYFEELQRGRKGTVERNAIEVLAFVSSTLARFLYIPGNIDLAREYSYCPTHTLSRTRSVPLWLLGLVLIIVGYAWFVKKKHSSYKLGVALIFVLFISVYLGVFIYGVIFKGDLFDHYLATLPPLFYILIGYAIWQIPKKLFLLTWIFGVLFIFMNLKQITTVTHSFGYANKVKAVKWVIATTGTRPFSLDVLGDCYRYNGYRYLFYLFGKEPDKSYVDANLFYLYDIPPALTHPPYLVVITNPDEKESPAYWNEYEKYTQKLVASAKFGKIEVLIIDNSKLDFVGKF